MTPTAPPIAPPQKATSVTSTKFAPIQPRKARRIGLYGTGGIGKTTLAATAPGPVVFIDLEDSLPVLADSLADFPVRVVGGIDNWAAILAALNKMNDWQDIKTIVIDTMTRAEELALVHTLQHVPAAKDSRAKSIEDYGYGKGFQHLYDTFLPLLFALDSHVQAGRNVVTIMHECVSNVPNPTGEDWIRYEPRLQTLSSGKASIRLRVKEWLDELLFIGYDVHVKDGVGAGSGTRTIYPLERPHCMAKSRSIQHNIPLTMFSTTLWEQIFKESK